MTFETYNDDQDIELDIDGDFESEVEMVTAFEPEFTPDLTVVPVCTYSPFSQLFANSQVLDQVDDDISVITAKRPRGRPRRVEPPKPIPGHHINNMDFAEVYAPMDESIKLNMIERFKYYFITEDRTFSQASLYVTQEFNLSTRQSFEILEPYMNMKD